MVRAKIIVTSNPSNWEGDFRLCEALASGALIFVDQMYVPRQYEFKENKHLVVYNNWNKTDLFEKLDAYRVGSQKENARRIAVSGYLHAMRYHRAANLIDYIFPTLQIKLLYEAKHLPQPVRLRTDYQNNGGNHPLKHEAAIVSKPYNPDG